MTETTSPAPSQTVVNLHKEAGWGAWITVKVAPTPEADAAAAAFFKRVCHWDGGSVYHTASVDEEASTHLGEALSEYFYPICEHGLSAHLCAGPGHYPPDDHY